METGSLAAENASGPQGWFNVRDAKTIAPRLPEKNLPEADPIGASAGPRNSDIVDKEADGLSGAVTGHAAEVASSRCRPATSAW